MRALIAAHPRMAAWLVLALIFIGLIALTTLGRELGAAQFAGLALVAVITAGISVALVFDDRPQSHSDG